MNLTFKDEVTEIKKRVLSYMEDSRKGKVPQGQKMLHAIERFQHDLDNQNDKNYPYYMDWEEVHSFNVWASMFKHRKGKLAGQHIELVDYQLFLVANIFGLKFKDSDYRKYKEAYIQVGRKNAKSQLIAIMTSYVAFLSDEQEEIYISSWTRDQSNLVYNEALGQIEMVDMLRDKYTDSYHQIKVFNNGSIIKALSREARKTGDGTNPSMAVLDEYKDNQTSELKDTQKTGMVARPNRLLVIITTAGFDLDYPAFSDYEYYSRILDPESKDSNDEIFIAISEMDKDDDVKLESNWEKANPIVASYKEGMDYLRSEAKRAFDQPETMRAFLTKNMNVWVDQKEDGYLSLEKWNNQEKDDEFVKEFLNGANLYYGIDLSATTDLTSFGWVAVKNGEFLVGQHSYTPEEEYRKRVSQERVRFDLFQDYEELTVTPGAVVDYNYLKEDLIEWANKHGVKQIGFDLWNANLLATDLSNEGFQMVEVKQSISALTEATKGFRENVYKGTLYHTGDTLLHWAINNAVVQEDQNGNIKINKARSRDRVDPLDAILNAFSLALYDNQVNNIEENILAEGWSF